VIDGQLTSSGGAFTTTDGGKTWMPRDANATTSDTKDLRADPVVNGWAYARNSNGLVKSPDGAESFQNGLNAGDVNSFDVQPGANGSMLVVGHANRKSFDRLNTNGGGWHSVPAPVYSRFVGIQPILDNVAVSDDSRMWLESNGNVAKARDITPGAGPPTQIQITAPLATGYAIVGDHGDTVLRRVQNLDNSGIAGAPGQPILLLPHGLPKQFPSTLTPGTTRLSLPAGASQDVSYRLLLPRTPSPVDVMFLVDTTASTENTINGLKQDLAEIVNDIGSTGLNAQFGVADFKDYSPSIDNLGDGETGDYPYRLDRRVGPSDASLRAALNELHARGGGDPPEAQLTALYQSTTGAGQHYPRRKTWIKYLQPGQSAGYRSDALKLAVLATDERFHREKSYLTPSWDKTVAALRSYDVHPIGLAIETVTDRGQLQGFHSLHVEQELARDTGSVAPA
ncbi:MAG TPA: vWA domain-containing protein, partial [Mycobacteriales bacterium]|nr:vWA domain-containing protein [Mycobacteriales bacterium]